jgi:hypothetical protein
MDKNQLDCCGENWQSQKSGNVDVKLIKDAIIPA